MARRPHLPANPKRAVFIHESFESADPNCSAVTFLFWADQLHIRSNANDAKHLRALLGRLVGLLVENPGILDEIAGLKVRKGQDAA
jgi:hypothetical protein